MDSITTSRTSNGAVTTYAAAGWRVAVIMPDTDEERWTLKVYVPGAVTIYLYEEDGGWARDAAMTILRMVVEDNVEQAQTLVAALKG